MINKNDILNLLFFNHVSRYIIIVRGLEDPEKEDKLQRYLIYYIGQVRYFVKWLNYPSGLNTWETPDNLENAQ